MLNCRISRKATVQRRILKKFIWTHFSKLRKVSDMTAFQSVSWSNIKKSQTKPTQTFQNTINHHQPRNNFCVSLTTVDVRAKYCDVDSLRIVRPSPISCKKLMGTQTTLHHSTLPKFTTKTWKNVNGFFEFGNSPLTGYQDIFFQVPSKIHPTDRKKNPVRISMMMMICQPKQCTFK